MDNQTKQVIPVMIYTEATPNPATLKFVVNRPLLVNDFVDFQKAEDAENAPLIKEIFLLGNINNVFISQNFITVTKAEASMWAELMLPIKEVMKQYLEEGKPIFNEQFKKPAQATNEVNINDSDLDAKIKGVLDKYVKPAVEMDGGAISFVSFEEGVLKLALQGSCSGCPSSTVTLKQGIENLMKRMVPEVISVESIAE